MTTTSRLPRTGRRRGPDSIVKNAVSTFAAQMTTASLTAVLTLFLVRGLGAKQYGLFALTIGMSTIAIALADLGISDSTARFVAERRDRNDTELGALVADALKLKIVATGLLCAVFAAFAPVIAHLYGNSGLTWPVRGIALATFGQSTYAMLLSVSTSMGRAAVNVRLVALESVLEVAASVALVLAGAGAAGAAFGRAAGFTLGAVIAAVVVLRLSGHGQVSFWRPPRRAMIRLVGGYAGPVFAIDASYTLSSSLSVLLVGAYLGSAASGVFQAPAKLIVLIQYVGLSTAYGVAPRLARGEGQEPNVKALNGALRGLIGFQCLMLAPAVVWAGPITHLLLGSGYKGSADVLAALAPYIFFSGLAPLVTTGVSYIGEAKKRVPIAIATLVLVAVSGVVLIPSHGVVGAAIATDIAFGFYTLAHIWLCRRLLELRLGVLVWSLACGLTAAAAMGIVLGFVGTTHLTIRDWIIGGAGGLAAYVGMLMFTSEIRWADIARATAAVRARRRRQVAARSTAAPELTPAPQGPAESVELGQPGPDTFPAGGEGDAISGSPPAPAPAPAPAQSPAPAPAQGPASAPAPGLASPPAPAAERPAVEPGTGARRRRRPLTGIRMRWAARAPAARLPIARRPDADEARRSPAAQPPAWLGEGFWSLEGHEPGPRVSRKEEDLPPGQPASSSRTKPPSRPRAKAAPVPRAKAPSPRAQRVPRAGADVVYQIVWRLVDDESGVFELRPVDRGDAQAGGASAPEQSPPVRWGWPMAPAPTPEARRAHAELVERLLAAAWRRAGSGDAWFAHCFQVPDRPSKGARRSGTTRRRTPGGEA